MDVFEVIGVYNHKMKGNWTVGNDENDGTHRIASGVGSRYIESIDIKKVGRVVVRSVK